MFVGQAAGWETTVLQHEIAMRELVASDPFFLVLLIIHICWLMVPRPRLKEYFVVAN